MNTIEIKYKECLNKKIAKYEAQIKKNNIREHFGMDHVIAIYNLNKFQMFDEKIEKLLIADKKKALIEMQKFMKSYHYIVSIPVIENDLINKYIECCKQKIANKIIGMDKMPDSANAIDIEDSYKSINNKCTQYTECLLICIRMYCGGFCKTSIVDAVFADVVKTVYGRNKKYESN